MLEWRMIPKILHTTALLIVAILNYFFLSTHRHIQDIWEYKWAHSDPNHL